MQRHAVRVAQPSFTPRNFIYPAGTHSYIEPYVHKEHAWSEDEYDQMNEAEYDGDSVTGGVDVSGTY